MRSFWKILSGGLGVIALVGIQACTAGVPEADLNPQPLPPVTGDPQRGPDEAPESSDSNKGGSMTGTGGGTSPPPAADGGTEGGDAAGGDR